MIWKFDNRWSHSVYKKACVLETDGVFEVRYYYGGGSCDKNKPNEIVASLEVAQSLAKLYVGIKDGKMATSTR